MGEITNYEFLNPVFFKTTRTRMSDAHFRILDSKTEDKPLFSRGSPTYIHCVCIPFNPRMKYPFSVFLDSGDKVSKNLYPENTNTDFRIQLAERLSFNENWKISLHGLFMTNLLDNIYSELCWIDIYQDYGERVKHCGKFEIPSNYYSSIDELIQRMNILIKDCPVKFSFQNNLITLWSSADGIKIEISQDLLEILGFDKKLNHSKMTMNRGTKIKSSFNSNINLLRPKTLIVSTDIVKGSVFGESHVKILRMIVNEQKDFKTIMASYQWVNEEKKMLEIRNFRQIRILILDVTGKPIQSKENIDTHVQLTFYPN